MIYSKYLFNALYLALTLALSLTLLGCNTTPKSTQAENPIKAQKVKEVASQFMTAYAFHDDFEYFLSFYAENAQVKDIIRGEKASGREAIKAFFNWHDEKFSLGNSASAVVVEEIWVDNSTAIVTGYFMPFIYDGIKFGPWHMMMVLEFDQDYKITKQVDWINYTPKVIFTNSPDSNREIKIPNYLFDD
ncbi:nuclear transport factor 2 family protein [Catenovulum sediminis]|uniref:Nuclear transport factor 2 family protein n=1 Tax=Catenovulum sediminis TaxID=1740262 RepID=A0ABV1RJJ1_9ALTE